MTLWLFQVFWFYMWKCEKECVKLCDNLKSWIPSDRRFHRYLKLQKRTNNAKAIRILTFSQKYIFHMHKIVVRRRIVIWCLRSARIKKLKRTDPNFFSKKMWVFSLQFFDPSTPKASNQNPNISRLIIHIRIVLNNALSYNLIKFCHTWEFKVSTESRYNFLCFFTLSR